MAVCLTVAALATGWVCLLAFDDSGWEKLFAILGLSVAGLALLAVLPHALVLRWFRRHRRAPVSPWPTLVGITVTAIPFPATIWIIASEPPTRFIAVIATLAVVLVVEINLMLHLSQSDKSRVELSSAHHRDDDSGRD